LINESYLREILDGQDLTENQKRNLRELRDKVEGQLRNGIKGTPKAYYGGSYAKNTMIKASYDLDLVLYWPNYSHLSELCSEVYQLCQKYEKVEFFHVSRNNDYIQECDKLCIFQLDKEGVE
jgi:tRNA nucleotidyltransferase (CCA-adding enzyme)